MLAAVLAPYKPHARYLKRAWFAHLREGDTSRADCIARIRGDFGIEASCYIDDTGHLNSVEVNICYNQIMYLLFAQCVEERILPVLAHMDSAEYRRRMLPDMLIHDLRAVFKKPIDARAFQGEMRLLSATRRPRFIIFKTVSSFHDAAGGRADLQVSLALVDDASGASSGKDRP